ncbi:MAG: hypothetical protein M8349_08160, partial [ANME-2 cluster archaeon]|nr:hypothetical protein [ANME-2 cluster archaeon]
MLTIRAGVADTKKLRTAPYDTALPFLFIREQTRTGDFNQQWDMVLHISNVLVVCISLLCFKARQS